jgi:OmpA-like transmembrane domain
MRKLLLSAALIGAISAAHSNNGLFYVGAGVSSNSVKVSSLSVPGGANFPFPDISATSWQAFAGVRPLNSLGFELAYYDMGSASSSYYSPLSCVGSGACGSTWHSDAKAVAGNVLGYLPIPVPYLDVYAKVGAASYTINRTGSAVFAANPLSGPEQTTYFNYPSKSTVFCWGAGFQVHFGLLGGRFEYAYLDKASTGIYSLSVFLRFM